MLCLLITFICNVL